MRKIPKKNYLIAFLLCLVTIIITIVSANYYISEKKYKESLNATMSFLSRIDKDSLGNYIVENHDAVIYVSDSTDKSILEFENQLKKMIIAKEYEKNILYFDTSNLLQDEIDKIKESYFVEELKNVDLSTPNVLIIKDGKIKSIMYEKKGDLNVVDMINYIIRNGAFE